MNNLDKTIGEEYNNITGIIVSKNEKIIYENYFNGYNGNDLIHVASVAKTITSILIGIAIDKKFITSVDDKIIKYFDDYKITKKNEIISNITIRNLLLMNVPYKCKYEPWTKVHSSSDWTKAAIDLIGGKEAIGIFRYMTVNSQILSGIISKTTNMSLRQFANKYLFEPLDINPRNSFKLDGKETYLSYIKNKGFATGWIEDDLNVSTGGWGIPLTVQEMNKIGNMCLNKGIYKNKQIVSKKWLEESINCNQKLSLFNKEFKYGYYWWIVDNLDYNIYSAMGDSGNIISIIPKLNMVVSITSSFYPRAKDRIELINNYIIPNFKDML